MKKIDLHKLILFENDDFLVANKPSGVATLEDRASNINMLEEVRKIHKEASACHRIDKETSGVLAFAKNPEAYRHLNLQFEHRHVVKVYHAMVDGVVEYDGEECQMPLKTSSSGYVKIDPMEGKEAYTIFNSLKLFKSHTLVECWPYTGRMHQIRVHLSYLGSPITADHTYGGKDFYLSSYKRNFNVKKWTEERPLISRLALHAHSLSFDLMNGEKVKVEAPYPKDLKVLLHQMEKYS